MLLLFRNLSGLEGASSENSVTNSSRKQGIVVLGVFAKKQHENGLSCCPCHYCHFFLSGLCKAVLSNFLISQLKKVLNKKKNYVHINLHLNVNNKGKAFF